MLMILRIPILLCISLTLMLAPIGNKFASAEEKPKVIATINGHQITLTDFQVFTQSRLGQGNKTDALTKKQFDALLNEFINRELLYLDALEHGFEKSTEVQLTLKNHERNVLASFNVQQLTNDPPSDAELKKLYDQQVKPSKEYKVRHILLKNKNDADSVISELKKGGDFPTLAKNHSVDSSAKQGGLLDWISPAQVDKNFAEALTTLELGKFTQIPVKSRFGWHVIYLENIRIIPPPPFEKVKDKLHKNVQNARINLYLQRLREKGEIKIMTDN